MLVDAREIDAGHEARADVCIIGAGVAGITLARDLSARGISVALLESGGFRADAENRNLYAGSSSGNVQRADAAYLVGSRVRHFGGSSNHWGGYCRPLEPIDFEEREWVPHSGWPFSRSDLDAWYAAASDLMGFGRFEDDQPDRGNPDLASFIEDDDFAERVFRFRPTRFGARFRTEIVADPRITLHLNANVVSIELHPDGNAVEGVVFGVPDGRRWKASARQYVLATGGIENARLLLASSSVHPKGIGNHHDLVGRFFMDHLVTHLGIGPMCVWQNRPRRVYQVHDRGDQRAQFVYVREEVLRRQRLRTAAVDLTRGAELKLPSHEWSELDRQVIHSAMQLDARREPEAVGDPRKVYTVFMCEQAPNPESRVALTDDRDPFGMPRVDLGWQVTDDDLDSVYRVVDLFSRRIAAGGDGRLRVTVPRERALEVMSFGSHHMGTTRMHASPERGVVDADCRVHGVANLQVAGSSVFPTSGAANPTFTILALTLRLGDRLGRVLGRVA